MRVWHQQARSGLHSAHALLDEALLDYAGVLSRFVDGWPLGRYDAELEREVREREESLGLFEAIEAQLLAALPKRRPDEGESGDRELVRG